MGKGKIAKRLIGLRKETQRYIYASQMGPLQSLGIGGAKEKREVLKTG